jgi:hypothetical protein
MTLVLNYAEGSVYLESDMTDKEIIDLAASVGFPYFDTYVTSDADEETARLTTNLLHQAGIAFARAIQKAESEACAVAIEELIPLLDPEREPTIRMCAYTCRNKYEPKEVDT